MDEQRSSRVRQEFTRQAPQMATAAAFHQQAVLRRFVEAAGDLPAGRVLDVACGPGIVAGALAPHVREVAGVDATPEMIRLAGERFLNAGLSNGRFEVASAELLPFEAVSFDRVVTRLSFHHFEQVSPALREMRRVLRDDGRLVAADIVCTEDAQESELHNSLEKWRDPSHVRFLSASRLRESIAAAGFAVIHEDSWQQERSFDEWAAIVADLERTRPLEQVMRALARDGQTCGMALHEEAGKLLFTHTWLMLVAEVTTRTDS